MSLHPIWHKKKHDLGGSQHVADTLADLNAKISDGTLIDSASKVVWKTSAPRVLTALNQVDDIAWTEIDLTATTSANATLVYLQVILKPDIVGAGNYVRVFLRKKGSAAPATTTLLTKNECIAGVIMNTMYLMGLDAGQVIEYSLDVTADWQVDLYIDIFAYIE